MPGAFEAHSAAVANASHLPQTLAPTIVTALDGDTESLQKLAVVVQVCTVPWQARLEVLCAP